MGKKPIIDRKTHKIDATDKSLGRLASEIARLLRGKHKPSFVYNVDNGDFVNVANVKFMKITGNKLEGKKYFSFSGYPGGLKAKQMKEIFEKDPGEVLRRAVFGMLPKNKLRSEMIKRLRIM